VVRMPPSFFCRARASNCRARLGRDVADGEENASRESWPNASQCLALQLYIREQARQAKFGNLNIRSECID
jgi:hypothetical protein